LQRSRALNWKEQERNQSVKAAAHTGFGVCVVGAQRLVRHSWEESSHRINEHMLAVVSSSLRNFRLWLSMSV
jgi:hypothetical protein